ncbi:MAG: nucleotidyltransferase domain-containing protein [Nitrospirae bacterium]|nr:nucleotidyltransferase domain-containing protein [Nitrospirota bacterium]
MIKVLDIKKSDGAADGSVIPSPLENAVRTIVRVVRPEKIILFGSYAAGTRSSESDYDILVLKKNLRDQRKLVQKIYLNFKNIGSPIDVLAVDIDKFETLKDDPYLIYYEADKKGKVIYERPPAKGKRMAFEGKK